MSNDIFYTCLPSTEAFGLGDTAPRKPYPVKVRVENGVLKAYCFNAETGEMDDDSNASCCPKPKDLFPTLKEATEAYNVLATRYAIFLLDETMNYVDKGEIRSLIETAIELLSSK